MEMDKLLVPDEEKVNGTMPMTRPGIKCVHPSVVSWSPPIYNEQTRIFA